MVTEELVVWVRVMGQVVRVVYVVRVSVDSLGEGLVPWSEDVGLVLGELVVRPVDSVVLEGVLELELLEEGQAEAVPRRRAMSGKRAEYMMRLWINESRVEQAQQIDS